MPDPDKKVADSAEIARILQMMAEDEAEEAKPAAPEAGAAPTPDSANEGLPPGAVPVPGQPGVTVDPAVNAPAAPPKPGIMESISAPLAAKTIEKVMSGKGAVRTSLEVGSELAHEGGKAVVRGVVGAAKETARGALALVGADKAQPTTPEEFTQLSLFQKAVAAPANMALGAPQALEGVQGSASGDPALAPATAVVENISRFATGFIGATKLLKAAGALQGATQASRFANASTAGGLSDFFSFGGTEGRLSDLIQAHPSLENPVSAYLASDPNDSELEGRLKNALEGLGIGAAMEGVTLAVLRGFRTARSLHQAGKQTEAMQVLEETQASVEPLITQSQGQIGKVRPLPGKELEVATQLRAAGRVKEADEILAGLGEGAGKKIDPTPPLKALPSDDLSGVLKDRLAHPEGKPDALVTGDLINYDRITGPDEVLKAMDDIASANRPELERARGKVETLQEIKDTARDLGMKPEDLVGDLEAYAASSKQARPKILAARQMIRRITEDAQLEAQKLLMQGAGADQSRLKAMFNTTSNLMVAVKGAQSEAARTLGSQRIIAEPFTGDLSDQALRMIAVMDDPSQLAGLVQKVGKVEATGNMLLQVYFNNILSSFTTHATNLGAGAANSLFLPFSKAVGGAASLDFHAAKEGINQFLSTFFVLKDSFKAAGKALKLDAAILDPRSAGLKGTGGAFQEAGRAFGMEGSWVMSMAKGLDTVTGISGRLLTSADELVKQTVARSQLRASALLEGAEQGLKGRQLADFLDARMRDAFEPTGALKDKQALFEARVATLTAPLLEGTLGKGIQDFVGQHQWLRPMVPFIRVPANAIRQGFQNTPLGLFYGEMREEIAKGGSARALAIGRMTVGTGVMSLGVMFALQGRITGSGPKDPNRKRALEADGWKPNSLVFENEDGTKSYVPYDRTDPIFKMWSLAADIMAAQHHMKESDKDNLAGLLVSAAARSVTSASYMKSVSDSFDIMSGDERAASRFMRNGTVSLVVPFSGAVKNIKSMVDPDLRRVESTLDAIYASIPGLSDRLAPKRDVLGEPMKAYRTGLGAINPFLYDSSTQDPVRRELARLAEDDQFFGMPAEKVGESKTAPIDLTKFKNEKGQSAYDRLLELRATVTDRSGKTLRDTLQDLIDSDKYKDASDGEGGYSGRKKDILEAIIGKYQNIAMNGNLRKEFPALDQALKQDERNAGASKKGVALTPLALPK